MYVEIDGKQVSVKKNGEPRKSGSGRTNGAVSFTQMTLAQLNEMFPNGRISIPISRKWAEQFFNVDIITAPMPTQNAVINDNGVSGIINIAAPAPEPVIVKPQFRDLNEDEE